MHFDLNSIITYESSSVLGFFFLGGGSTQTWNNSFELGPKYRGEGTWKKFKYQLLGSFNGSCRGIRALLVVEQKNPLGQNLADRWLQLLFHYFFVRRSSNSSALIKVLFQFWPITVPKQMQHHVTCRGLGCENFCLHRCETFPLNTVSFRAFFIVMDPCFFTRDS